MFPTSKHFLRNLGVVKKMVDLQIGIALPCSNLFLKTNDTTIDIKLLQAKQIHGSEIIPI